MKRTRNVLWIIFFASLAFIVVMLLAGGEPETGAPGPSTPSGESQLLVWIPLLTALVSLTGALTTSILTMRRDRLESQKMELEVTKLQLEIEQLKKSTGTGQPGKIADQHPEP